MSLGRHDKIEVGRIDKGGFEDEDTAENIGWCGIGRLRSYSHLVDGAGIGTKGMQVNLLQKDRAVRDGSPLPLQAKQEDSAPWIFVIPAISATSSAIPPRKSAMSS